jgi:inner membrane protein
MDPVTHTLVGVTLAESGLKRWTPLAATTLIIGVNLPDIDGIANLFGRDTALWLRRGWTHGVVALALLPAILGVVMFLWARRRPTVRPASLTALLALSYLSVLSHPALDWLNNYGIRLLMPFDGRWFYGDAVFIIDPWLWLVLGGAMAASFTRSRVGMIGWGLFAAAVTLLMFSVSAVPFAARVCWIVGVLAVGLIRTWRGPTPTTPRVASVCLAVAVVYIGSMVVGTRIAERQVASWVDREGLQPTAMMAGPVPANPFRRQVIVETSSEYHFLELDWLGEELLRVTDPPLARRPVSAVVAAALSAPSVRGVSGWLRFPRYEVETVADGYRVTIRDMRFARTLATGLGSATVELDANLRPR